MAHASIAHLFFDQARRSADRPFLFAKKGGRWEPSTWGRVAERVRATAKGLISLGVQAGDRVALLGENRPEWVIADLGTLAAGAADSPIYATNTPPQCAYIIKDSGARVCFVSTPTQLGKLLEARDTMPELEHIVCFDDPGPSRAPGVMTLQELEGKGAAPGRDGELEARLAALTPDSLLTLIYTSGTTGDPKGVMLTHDNLLQNCAASARAVPIGSDDVLVSFLPLSHSFERMAGYYMAIQVGATIYYAESIDKLVDNIGEVRPTVLCSVPRVYEKVYARFMGQVAQATGVKKMLMQWSLKVGSAASAEKQAGREPSGLLALKVRLATKLVFSKLTARLGGRIRFFTSGGAPLSGDIARFFHAAGMTILEGYGLTETSPVISINRLDAFKFGSVGKVIAGVDVKIAEDGEILCKGHNVMKGYWNKPEETAAVLSEEGWFATGDIGHIDADGFLWITDRKKDLIKTAGGKYVAPQEIENLLKLQRTVEQVHVVGDRRPYCTAVIVPSFDFLHEWARERNVSASDAELVADSRVRQIVQADVDTVNAQLARYQTIKKFVLAAEPFSQDNGMLTPTLKVKRKVVNQRYEKQIEALYAGAGASE